MTIHRATGPAGVAALQARGPAAAIDQHAASVRGQPRWSNLLTWVVVAGAVASHRLLLSFDTGGVGVTSVFVPATLLLGLLCLAVDARQAQRVNWARLLLVWGPFWACAGLLPLIAVSVGSYPTRVAFSSVAAALVPIAAVIIGTRVAMVPRDPGRALARGLSVAIPAMVLYAAAQAAYASGGLSAALWSPFAEWDFSSAVSLGAQVYSRSSGFYVNPNTLGFWGALTFVLAATLLRGGIVRPTMMVAAVITVVLSQSRGSFAALIAGALALVLIRRGSRGSGTAGSRSLLLLLAAGVTIFVVGSSGGVLGVSRLVEGLISLLPGEVLDPSVAGRLDFWSGAGALSAIYPLGTWGPPQLLLGTSVDSDWVDLFLQGSIVAVAAAIWMLAGGAISSDRSMPAGRAVAAASVVVAVAMLTQEPLSYPPIALYWLVVGFSIVAGPAGVGAPVALTGALASETAPGRRGGQATPGRSRGSRGPLAASE